MKNTNKLAASIALASALTAQSEDNLDLRIGTTYSGNLETKNFRTTLGIAPQGAYDGAVIAHKGQFMEYFRAYDNYNPTFGTHTIAAGAKVPSLRIGNLENKAIIFGALADTQGLGIETDHRLGDLSMQLNAEHSLTSDKTRLGGGINYQIGKTQIGLGYDFVSNPDSNQFLGNTIIDLTDRSTAGLGLAVRDKSYSIAGFWLTTGDKDRNGFIVQSRFDNNHSLDSKNLSGEAYWATYPATGKSSASWIVGRNVKDDEMFNQSLMPLSVSLYEPWALFDRSRGGFSLGSKWNFNKTQGKESGSVSIGAGYHQPGLWLGTKPALSLEVKHAWTQTSDVTTLEPQFLWRMKAFGEHYTGPFIGASIPIAGNNNQDTQYRFGGIWTW